MTTGHPFADERAEDFARRITAAHTAHLAGDTTPTRNVAGEWWALPMAVRNQIADLLDPADEAWWVLASRLHAPETSHDREKRRLKDQADPATAEEFDQRAAANARTQRRARGEEKSTPTLLIELASACYDLVQALDGTAYAVRRGTCVAVPIEGGRSSLRAHLAAEFHDVHGRAPGRNALSEALEVLRGQAMRNDRVPVELRHGTDTHGTRWIDLGDRFVALHPTGDQPSTLEDRAGVIFRRTELLGAMPTPDLSADPDDLDALRALLNVTDDAWPLVVAWLVAVLAADIAVPALLLSGEQGAGKTTAAKILVALADPSPAPVRAAPKDVDAWIVAAAGSRVVALDNLSHVPEWLSDALCRAVTGEGLVRRALYTDSELAVTAFRRAVILTSIDTGALRGDLGERVLSVELERITDNGRRTDRELAETLDRIAPRVLGALLTLTADALGAVHAGTTASPRPRMADFGDLLAGIDAVTGWATLDLYRANVARTMSELATGDQLAQAIRTVVADAGGEWEGTSAELLAALGEHRPDDRRAAWPKTPRGLAGALRRLSPALRAVGIDVENRVLDGRTVYSLAKRSTGSGVSGVSGVVPLLHEVKEQGEGATCNVEPTPLTPLTPLDGAPCCDRCGASVARTVTHHATGEQWCPRCCRGVAS